MQQAGYPTTPEELDEYCKIPEGVTNAVDTYNQAFLNYIPLDPIYKNLVPFVGTMTYSYKDPPLSAECIEATVLFLTQNTDCLQLLHEAAKIPNCRYTYDFNTEFDPDANIELLRSIKKSALLLRVEALYNAENNHPARTAVSISDFLAFSRSISKEPYLINHLVHIALESMSVSSLEHALNRTGFTEKQLITLREEFSSVHNASESAMSFALTTELYLALQKLKYPQSKNTTGQHSFSYGLHDLFYRVTGLYKRNSSLNFELLINAISKAKLDPSKRTKAFMELETDSSLSPFQYLFLNDQSPVISHQVKIDLRVIANLRMAETALAVELYRYNKGNIPDTLQDLVPEYLEKLPLDPFDEHTLRYIKTDPGYIIYTVGEDLSDPGVSEVSELPDYYKFKVMR